MKFRRRAMLSRSDLVGRKAFVYPDPASSESPLSEHGRWSGKVKALADDRSVDVAVAEPAERKGWTLRVTPHLPEGDLVAALRGEEVAVDLLLAKKGSPAVGASNAVLRLSPR